IALFLVPAGRVKERDATLSEELQGGNFEGLLEWKDANRLPWGILLLFGGGLSMASAISSTGLASWIGNGIGGPPSARVKSADQRTERRDAALD
ncbi:MAG: anion permease, partial [Flavobacteriales bacterium]